ncbi:MAG TPA: exodeoxyribonuclease VII large subunit, partial [Candidatus Hydrogenedentes bacterium]|nr:exodeoxyribonuclease VII large subunit [Candidatus Hydrogenedentota bacterium]
VVTGVGHETDTTLVDFAADLRAPTPSAAAEIVAREKEGLEATLQALLNRARRGVELRRERLASRLDQVSRSLFTFLPERIFQGPRLELDRFREGLESAMRDRLAQIRRTLDMRQSQLNQQSPVNRLWVARERLRGIRLHLQTVSGFPRLRYAYRLTTLGGKLHALSPLAVLGRGYALAWRLPDRLLIRSAAALAPGMDMEVRFGEGAVTATVREVNLPSECQNNAGGDTGG